MKKVLTIMLVCALLLVMLVGCGTQDTSQSESATQAASESTQAASESAEESTEPAESEAGGVLEGKIIGYTPYWLDVANASYADWTKQMLEAEGATVEIMDPNGDAAVQRAQLQDWIARGIDAVIYCPVEPPQTVPMVQLMWDNGIRVAGFWNIAPDEELEAAGIEMPIYELGNESVFFEAGQQAAKFVRDELGQTPKAIIFDGKSNPVLAARAEGFAKGLMDEEPMSEIVFRDEVGYTQEEARQKMQDLMLAYPDFNIVCPHTGDSSVGAFSALQTADKANKGDNWFLFVEPDKQRLEWLFDKTTSAEAVMIPDLRTGGEELANSVIDLFETEDWQSVGNVGDRGRVPGIVMLKDDVEGTIAEYDRICSNLPDYVKLDPNDYK